MMLSAKQASDRGDKSEAEQLCARALEYVGTTTVNKLQEYAALLKMLRRQGAEAAQAKADKLREVRSQPGGGYLGFIPADELVRYAGLLQELGRSTEAEAIRALARADFRAQRIHVLRTYEYVQGRDPRGRCND